MCCIYCLENERKIWGSSWAISKAFLTNLVSIILCNYFIWVEAESAPVNIKPENELIKMVNFANIKQKKVIKLCCKDWTMR